MLDLQNQLWPPRQRKHWQFRLLSKLLFKAGDLRLVLVSFEAGARIKAPGVVTIFIHSLQGLYSFMFKGESHEVCPGQILTVLARLKHDVEAR
jgi:quercetin dioxygenase-like cupin family protein